MTAADAREVRDRFAVVPLELSAAAVGAEGSPVPAGEWGPAEVVRHLIAVEEIVWQRRLRQLASVDRPTWPWIEPEAWSGEPAATLGDLLAIFRDGRAETVAILDGMNAQAWARTGVHAEWGEIDVAELVKRAIEHDEEHLAGLRAASVGGGG